MRIFNSLIHLLLLVITPTFLLFPQYKLSSIEVQHVPFGVEGRRPQLRENTLELTYDEVLTLIKDIESGELSEDCSREDIERINYFLAHLAREGALYDEPESLSFLENDIAALLTPVTYDFQYWSASNTEGGYLFATSEEEFTLCKSWLTKSWDKTKEFVKEHKKEIIIGAVIVVAVAVVVVAVVAVSSASAAAAVGSAASAGAAAYTESQEKPSPPISDAPILKSALDEQIYTFKENIASESFFGPSSPQGEALSWEETGRVLGPLFAHESFNNLSNQLATSPRFAQEIETIRSQTDFPHISSAEFGHTEIDQRFSADYASLFSSPCNERDFRALSYEMHGKQASALGYFGQAVDDFGKAIELNPTNPTSYLERGFAHFSLGDYDSSLEDFQQFVAQKPETHPMFVSEFSLGFAKGLPKGVYESGEGILLFLADLVTHPIHTGWQMFDALTTLADLARTDEWGVIGEVLSPEVHQLVVEWDTLPSEKRGELAGYAFGKHGADIAVPGALAKVASKSAKSARELSSVCNNLKRAEKTLLLESAAGVENGARIAEVVQFEQRVSAYLGEGARLVRNKAGDPIFISKDGLRKVRFDFKRPHPHESPHLHIEHLVDGEWEEISRIYPVDVPHK
jgi:tetratricopeptide (TPR) repeat protein